MEKQLVVRVDRIDLTLMIQNTTNLNPKDLEVFNTSIFPLLTLVKKLENTNLDEKLMESLVEETARLKKSNSISKIPVDDLVYIVSFLERSLDVDVFKREDGELTLEQVQLVADACLAGLNILTASNVAKRAYQEELLEKIVLFFKVFETMVPSTVQDDCTIGLGLYRKLCQMVNLLAELIDIQVLPESMVTCITTTSISSFLRKRAQDLQASMLGLISKVFRRYRNWQEILNETLSRVGEEDLSNFAVATVTVNSFTVLILQLTKMQLEGPESKRKVRSTKTSTQTATSIAVSFVKSLLCQCEKNKDLAGLFNSFVEDLVALLNGTEWPCQLFLTLAGKILMEICLKGIDANQIFALESLGLLIVNLCKLPVKNEDGDQCLSVIALKTKDPVPLVRIKALKAFAFVLESDLSLLGREEVKEALRTVLFDQSALVRERAVDLAGKFVKQPRFLETFHADLSDRILDPSVNVAKKAVTIMGEVCMLKPELTTETCVKMINCESAKRQVVEFFAGVWCSSLPCEKRVECFVEVVGASKAYQKHLQGILQEVFEANKPTLKTFINSLVGQARNSIPSITSLLLLARIHPPYILDHITTLNLLVNPLDNHPTTISTTIEIFSLAVPLKKFPKDCLERLEQVCVDLVLKHDSFVVSSCVKCLKPICEVTKNFNSVKDCFEKYYGYLQRFHGSPERLDDPKVKQYFKRCVFTLGVILEHFTFTEQVADVFNLCLFFLDKSTDVQIGVLKALRSICSRNYEFALDEDLNGFYVKILTSQGAATDLTVEVLTNIESLLLEEQCRMTSTRPKWEEIRLQDLDMSSPSTIQQHLKGIAESYLNPNSSIRQLAQKILTLVLEQGSVCPVQIVPYLIAMSTDPSRPAGCCTQKQLLELDKAYPGFVQSKAIVGLKLSFKLQTVLQGRARGCAKQTALHESLYGMFRSSRQQRRSFMLGILRQFDVQPVDLNFLTYLADNLAHFPYVMQDEPLFVIYRIDIMASISGMNFLQNFRKCLSCPGENQADLHSILDEDENYKDLKKCLPEDLSALRDVCVSAEPWFLLLLLKQHFKVSYGLTDLKIGQYSPLELAKVYDKPLTVKEKVNFQPKLIMQRSSGSFYDLIEFYLQFKNFMFDVEREANVADQTKVIEEMKTPSVGSLKKQRMPQSRGKKRRKLSYSDDD